MKTSNPLFNRGTIVVNLCIVLLAGGCSKEPQVAGRTIADQISDKFLAWELMSLDIEALKQQVDANRTGLITMRIDPPDQRAWDLMVTLVDDGRSAEIYVNDVQQPSEEILTLKGYQRGTNEPCVVTLSSTWFSAVIIDRGEEVFIDPLWDILPQASKDAFIVYRGQDVVPDANRNCGVENVESGGTPVEPILEIDRGYTCMKVPMTLVADIEYSAHYSNNTTTISSKMTSAMNNASLCYWQNSNPRLLIDLWKKKQFIYTTIESFSSLNNSTLLSQFRAWGQANVSGRRSTLNMLFTGKSVTVGGLAYSTSLINGVIGSGPACTYPSNAYCFVKWLSTSSQQRVNVAHEAAHLMGHQPHIANTIMSSTSSAYNYNSFTSLFSYSYIVNHMWNEQCFSSQSSCN